jgi:hypothetical protein
MSFGLEDQKPQPQAPPIVCVMSPIAIFALPNLPDFIAVHESGIDVVDGARSQQRSAIG